MDGTKNLPGLALALEAALAGCANKPRALIVASKNFTEQLILGEMIAQHVEHRLGQKVERRLNLGGTMLAHQALVSGQIDLYPEYTGTAQTAILRSEPSSNPVAVWEQVRAEYLRQHQVLWLEPFGFNNTFVIVVRGEDARKYKLTKISQLEDVPEVQWRLGVGYEFVERSDGLKRFNRMYRVRYKSAPQTMDLGLLYRALETQQVDIVAGNATDAMLSVRDLKILEDDQHCFPPYQGAIAVRQGALNREPGLEKALRELSGKISDEAMRKMNYEVEGKKRAPAAVANDFLRASIWKE